MAWSSVSSVIGNLPFQDFAGGVAKACGNGNNATAKSIAAAWMMGLFRVALGLFFTALLFIRILWRIAGYSSLTPIGAESCWLPAVMCAGTKPQTIYRAGPRAIWFLVLIAVVRCRQRRRHHLRPKAAQEILQCALTREVQVSEFYPHAFFVHVPYFGFCF